ncbi:MAG: biopolymer transporter ExbB [Ferrovum sp. 37-45-19]|uniref:MotA/TolQ/ExbB proton channel family protein n=1 Tax=Ferrovum sp. JA12 TaxID=1356299 RepID=UPI0007154CA0|nr:MotA/TolQ/ExbB proton channel family protein [Ferrovum sp. JA12]OYV79176.1 MAG: biopolymer transporter ExbB [Ferrovum sp. 21-44-67]OYV93537.1 MAG: biopolymer transporter ExbB [Ferrovum sp. 37-45-19]HQT81793.1 MotA/TolQ/ExbB proton channel family protein [Ferrovaceae bacterium]KRH79621.1 biopolymer transport protein ExbB [Ferrovum sp. JA12]HQU06903.1 MotA/TolQ/ExbB proton channel family protein [Ferrovaceae bacterium]
MQRNVFFFLNRGLVYLLMPLSCFKASGAEISPSNNNALSNPYGLDALWANGDLIARGTLVILLIMSVASWYMLVIKLLEQRRLFRTSVEEKNAFWQGPLNMSVLDQLPPHSAYRFLAQSGIQAREEYQGQLSQHISLNTWVENNLNQAFDQVQARLQIGLALLGTVGSTAPFIGLFGTVWGIYHALTAIGISGQASIDKVAGPVGEALIMTAIGLAVAVPAVLIYNWLLRRNKNAMTALHGFANDLEKVLLGGRTPQR